MIDVQIDLAGFEDAMGMFADQLPYATAKAINDTMKEAQKSMVSHIADAFTVRRMNFVKRSVKISQFAKKESLTGILGIANVAGKPTADILGKFEEGGQKHPESAHVAVPTQYIRPDTVRVIPASKRPRNLSRGFKITTHQGTEIILQRKGKGHRSQTEVAYVLKTSVPIDNRLSFVRIVTDSISQNFERIWTERANEAINTRK